MKNEKHRMTFDQLQRYRLAADLIDNERNGADFTILDAGSHQGFLSSFLPRDTIYNLDQRYFSHDKFIQGDVLFLPFPDEIFNISLAIDILEHIPAPSRLDFIKELVRVSGDIVVIGAPFDSKEVAEAEKLALEFCERMTGEKHEFLAEHLIEGLPDLKKLTGWTAERGLQTVVLPNGYLYHWFLMICLNFYLGRIKDPWEFIFAVNRFYFNRFYEGDNREPAYRHFVIISKRGSLDPDELAAKFVSPADSATMPDPGSILKEINQILDFVHRERVSGLTAEKDGLRKERDTLREEKEAVRRERDELIIRLETARAELNGIKSTILYRIYKKIRGTLSSETE